MTATANDLSVASQHHVAELIVPVDFSPQAWHALPLARSLASALGVKFSPVHVDVNSRPHASVGPVIALADVAGLATTVQIVTGPSVAAAMTTMISRQPGATVVMTTHGRSGVGWLVRGNLCRDLMDRLDGPLIAVGPRFAGYRHTDVHRVLACLDPNAPDCRLVEDCASWAAALRVPLSVVCVQSSSGGTSARLGEDAVRLALDGFGPAFRDVSVEVLCGVDPAAAIVQEADRIAGTIVGLAPGAAREPHLTTHSVAMYAAREGRTAMLLRSSGHDDDGQ